jgi:hypothetical protein
LTLIKHIDSGSEIVWSPNYTLNMSNFKKKFDDKPSVIKGIMKRIAVSYLLYDIDFDLKFTEDKKKFRINKIKLQTLFDQDYSYLNLKELKIQNVSQKEIDFLILHEQGHFDLREILKSKMERDIASKSKGKIFTTKGSDFQEIEHNANVKAGKFLQPLYEKISQDVKKHEDLYDKKTNHGRNKQKQIQYNRQFKQFRKIRTSSK